ncbi:hypothetical protein QFZ94_000393 [Paraburkholderia sp. JPY465]
MIKRFSFVHRDILRDYLANVTVPERRMRGFRLPERTQAFLSNFGPIRQHFALKRHRLRASRYRQQLALRFAAWHRFTEFTQNPSIAF